MGVYFSESVKGGKGVEEDLNFFVLRLTRILEAISGPPLIGKDKAFGERS